MLALLFYFLTMTHSFSFFCSFILFHFVVSSFLKGKRMRTWSWGFGGVRVSLRHWRQGKAWSKYIVCFLIKIISWEGQQTWVDFRMPMYLNFSKWALFYLRGKISERAVFVACQVPKFPRKRKIKKIWRTDTCILCSMPNSIHT